MKIGDLVKLRNSRARNPLHGIIVAIDVRDPGWVSTRYVVRWQGLDVAPSFTQRHEYADIQVLSEA
jgi:hypothetical protein